MRIFCALLLISFSVMADIRLKNSVVIESSRIRLSDFFENLPQSMEDKELLDAPKVGETLILPYVWLKEFGENLGLSWAPHIGDKIIFTRAKKEYDKKDIEGFVSRKLQEDGEVRDFQISLNHSPLLELPTGDDVRMELDHIQKDAESEKFRATLKIYERETFKREYALDGKFQLVIQVPVLSIAKHAGEEIKLDDLDWRKVPISGVSHLIATHQDQVIGFVPSNYPLKPGEFIKKHEIKRPILVSKNSEVNLVIKTPQLMLSTKGKALDDGVFGSAIRVMNTDSKKIIQGTVKSTGLVEVMMPMSSVVLGQVSP